MRHTVALVCLVLAGCSTTLETVFVRADSSGWKLGAGSDRPGQTIAEYVPRGESINNWTQLLSIQFLEGETSRPREVMRKLQTLMQTRCPGSMWDVVHEDSASVLYEWRITKCGASADQHEVARLLKGNDGVHRVAYVQKPSIPVDERARWIKALSDAYVEKAGQRVVVAP
jgi:hypothetical protein